jgi:DNA (cytosine-5)-methyltransferase 1
VPGLDLAAAADAAFLRRKSKEASSSGNTSLRVADLFSGCGAMSLGVDEACHKLGIGFQPSLVCDVNQYALDVYAQNFGLDPLVPTDLDGLSSLIGSARTPLEIALQRNVEGVDFVVAGPPCQGHSNLNNHTRRNDPKNALYLKVARFSELFRPRFVVVENVPAVVNDKQDIVSRTEAALRTLGYRVTSDVAHLVQIGVPQTRRRHLMIAIREDEPIELPTVQEIIEQYSTTTVRSLDWAIGDLIDAVDTDDLYDGLPDLKPVTRERIDHLFDNGLHNLPDEERPDCHRTKQHSYPSVYGRMYWDRPAPTITSGFVTMGRGRFVHPLRRRTLTAHEAARLQFIPDWFSFRAVEKRGKLAELIGNAVPPKLSYVVAVELLR